MEDKDWENLKKEKVVEIGWYIQLAEIFEFRKNLKQAHLILTEALRLLIDYYYLKNKQFIPHSKWKYYYFQKLRIPNKSVKDKIFSQFIFKDYSSKTLHSRANLLKKLLIKEDIENNFQAHIQNTKAIKNFKATKLSDLELSKPW